MYTEACKSIYPGKSNRGIVNYRLTQLNGNGSTSLNGPVSMELKVAITLRLLAGASYQDMNCFNVSMESLHFLFLKTLHLMNKACPDRVFNYCPEMAEKIRIQIFSNV
jgi:hypothetical protein